MRLHFPSTRTLFEDIQLRIEDLEVRFLLSLPRCIRGNYLRHVRHITPLSALLVTLLFSLYCTRPRPLLSHPPVAVQPAPPNVYLETGEASWYGGEDDGFTGRQTANGETYNPDQATCAHRTLPFGTWVDVENLANGRHAVLRVNDRGPFSKGRILDVSQQGAKSLGLMSSGKALVQICTVDQAGHPAALDPSLNASNPFTIQVASLRDPANAERLTRELRNEFSWVNLQDVMDRQGNSIKRVCVGSFISIEEAEKTADQIAMRLRDRGVEPFITRRR